MPVLLRDPLLYDPGSQESLSAEDAPLRPIDVSDAMPVELTDDDSLPSPLDPMDGDAVFERPNPLPSNVTLL